MATTTTGAVATVTLAAVMMTAGAARSDALTAPDTTVVLHVKGPASVPAATLVEAERLVQLVYGSIGVHLAWTDGHAVLAPTDGALHLDVQLLPRIRHPEYLDENVGRVPLGAAYEPARLARVFVDRIADEASRTGASVSLILGAVIAHEVGHLLLPPSSHSSEGLMRAHWRGRLSTLPGFTTAQGTTIRARLATSGREPRH